MKHGMSGTRFYNIWCSMKQRCEYPQHNRFKGYGGRGIKILWKSFEEFKKDMYKSYQESGEIGMSIDRIDSNGHYSKENCRWVSLWQQNLNRTNNRLLTYKGITKPLSQWSKDMCFKRGVLENRLKRGWSVEKSLTTPIMSKFSH